MPEFDLESLIAGITSENLYEEIDFGVPVRQRDLVIGSPLKITLSYSEEFKYGFTLRARRWRCCLARL